MICQATGCQNEFEPKHDRHVFCSDRCRWRERERNNPLCRERNKARCARWYANPENKAKKIAEGAAIKKARQTTRGEWMVSAPDLGYLPGAFVPIALANGFQFEHWQISALHGMVTSITGPHTPNDPKFSLFPWHKGCGWAAYIHDVELARSIAMKTHVVDFRGEAMDLAVGWMVRVKAPKIPAGAWKMRVTAITPVQVRNAGVTTYTSPTANNIRGTLEAFTARRLGIHVDKHDVQVEMIDHATSPDRINLSGRSEFAGIRGWIGTVDLRVNALARLMLESCAMGMGLGGKTAFGFGRVKVEAICTQRD